MRRFNWQNLVKSGSFWFTALALTLTLAGIGLTFWQWDWLHDNEPETSASTTLRNVGLLLGGVIALVFAIWRGIASERQANASQSQAKTALHQSETAQQGLLNERYQKGAEMLGNGVLAVRLGGIHALQRLAKENPEQYHIQVTELFCAFIRFPTDDKMMASSRVIEEQDGYNQTLRPDVQDAMRFLGSRGQEGIRLERREGFKLYLRGANISNLQTVDANLSRAWLTKANLSNAVLIRADLSEARLRRANLSNSRLRNANLYRAFLNSADLSRASLDGANLSNASLNRANLSSNVSLNGTILSNASLHYAYLSYASLDNANLSNASLYHAYLSYASLQNADLSGAFLQNTVLEGANLTGASFSRDRGIGGRRNPATGLTQAQLDEARSDPENPPKLEGVLDAETGEQLVWNGKPLDDDP